MRPTPAELATSPNDVIALSKEQLLADLRQEGYMIIHPDDVPIEGQPPAMIEYVEGWRWADGWRACRGHIISVAT